MVSFSSFFVSIVTFSLIITAVIIPFYFIMSILTMGLESTLDDLVFCVRNAKHCCNRMRARLRS